MIFIFFIHKMQVYSAHKTNRKVKEIQIMQIA